MDKRIFILSDMEAVNGAVYDGYHLPRSGEDDYSRRRMTGEVNAAIQACVALGTQKITLYEAHAFYRQELPSWVAITNDGFPSNPRYDAMIFIGQHAKSSMRTAVRSHTGSSRSITRLWVNGKEFGEFGICSAYMGCFGIPTIFLSGDRAAAREARKLIPNIETVCVEEGLGNHSAVCLSHKRAMKLINERVGVALRRAPEYKPLCVKGPVEFKIQFQYCAIADEHARIPGVKRLNDNTTIFKGRNYLSALTAYKTLGMSLAFWDM